MNRPLLDKLVSAVLYEGYVLDPQRPSVVRGRQRCAFGGLSPQNVNEDAESRTMRTECLVRGGPHTTLQVEARFLHLLERKIGVVEPPSDERIDLDEMPPRYVDHYDCGGAVLHAQQEAVERDRRMAIDFTAPARGEIQIEVSDFDFPARRQSESIRDGNGAIGAVVVREQHAINGSMEVGIALVADGLFKVRVQIENRTPIDPETRHDATLAALMSTHAILSVERGEFLSMNDPPAACRGLAANMHNVGCWPVLVGQEGERDTMLASPILLHDYPSLDEPSEESCSS